MLHRDLKPGNIMLGQYGETLVVDWGLAKVVGRPERGRGGAKSTLATLVGQRRRPRRCPVWRSARRQYMSPEQAAGRLDLLGPASDVYSLGATLYCLLTGRAAVRGAGDVDVVSRKVRRGDFPPPRQVNRRVPPALGGDLPEGDGPPAEGRYARPVPWPTTSSVGWPTSRSRPTGKGGVRGSLGGPVITALGTQAGRLHSWW